MRRWETFAVPGLLAAYLIAYVVQVRKLPFSATIYPYALAALIVAGIAAIVAVELRAAPDREPKPVSTARPTRRAAFLLIAVAYPPLMGILGFAISTFILSLLLLRIFGERRLGRTVLASAALSLGFFFTVGALLGIPLPPFSFAELPFGL